VCFEPPIAPQSDHLPNAAEILKFMFRKQRHDGLDRAVQRVLAAFVGCGAVRAEQAGCEEQVALSTTRLDKVLLGLWCGPNVIIPLFPWSGTHHGLV
jgi:hypothetical protein